MEYLNFSSQILKKERGFRMKILSKGTPTAKSSLPVLAQIILLILSPDFPLLCQNEGNIAKLEEIYKAPTGQDATVAYWKFDGNLRESSGRGHDISAESASFGVGYAGQALNVGIDGSVANSPDLQLAPGLRIECWIRFESYKAGFPSFIRKEKEYQLRVDPQEEGGRFSFFVYLNGWEPRVSSKIQPRPGEWYHIIAMWDGYNATLEVNGEKTSVKRTGILIPTRNPLEIGTENGMIDELRIENPMNLAIQKFLARAPAPQPGSILDHFGKGIGWPGWVGLAGAKVVSSGDKLEITLPDSQAMLVNPSLDLDLNKYRYICCDISSSASQVMLLFITTNGYGIIPLQTFKELYTSVLELNDIPTWRGRLKFLAFWIPGPGPNDIRLENLWISSKPEGGPFLKVKHIAWEHAILDVGKEEKLIALVECLGSADKEAKGVVAQLQLPNGVRCAGSDKKELGTMPVGTTKMLEWTVRAARETEGEAVVKLTAENCPPSSKSIKALFMKPFVPLKPKISVPGTTYYIDSIGGSNSNSGLSPQAPWKDFTNINGKTLKAGDRILIKRGSVINQELRISVRGTKDNWVEIGAYGTGPRPVIRRNWHILDRCILITNPDYLWIHSLVVCCAASGIFVHYTEPGHAGLVIEDCLAYHIEGRYGGYLNSTGIPEWRDLPELQPPGYYGIGMEGVTPKDITLRNCEMFHTSSAFFVMGERVMVERVFAHNCYVHNTCPHPYVVNVKNAILQNSVLDASGGHASRGTMGIMLANTNRFIIRNSVFRNMPDSGSYDQGGIDFEAGGDGCLVEGCTFENNAGAAIEVLGLRSPQAKNVEIRNCRFIKNNWVKRNWGPAEIYIWEDGANPDPNIVCSTGTIYNNGYVLLPGVEFFSNRAKELTWWRLFDNKEYATVEEIRKAMPFNEPPIVEAGEAIHSDASTVQLAGKVRDDGKPAGKKLKARWEVLEGPGEVIFEKETSPDTKARFSKPGDYLLRLIGDDGELWTSDLLAVHILPKGTYVINSWEFNRQLDKEGWSEINLGTRERKEGPEEWEVTKPVKYVSGGYYIVAIENSKDAALLSPDNLGVDLSKCKAIRVRFQNHTPATKMRFSFTTIQDPVWDDAKSKTFEVIPWDNEPHTYVIDMRGVPGWRGILKQLRFDLATGSELTGTCRIDYIWLEGNLLIK
jgi:hypothetical protein